MKKWLAYAILFVFIAGVFIFLNQLPAKPAKKTSEPAQLPNATVQVSALCANFTDASSCDSAVKKWEEAMKGGKTFAVVDYQPDMKSTFKEGWVIYMLLPKSLQIPGTNKTTHRIGILADKNSNESMIYEFVE